MLLVVCSSRKLFFAKVIRQDHVPEEDNSTIFLLFYIK